MLVRFFVSLVLFSLIACGGGAKNAPTNVLLQGKFIDSAVNGLRYATNTQTGFTGSDGEFFYYSGETISFFIGDIFLGATQANNILTPVDLVRNAKNETNGVVSNIARLLLTLDTDQDPSNGIEIPAMTHNAATQLSLDFALDENVFATQQALNTLLTNIASSTDTAQRNLIATIDAQSHLRSQLLRLYQGNYRGVFIGSNSEGTWEITLDEQGLVSQGSAKDSNNFNFPITGNIKSDGTALIESKSNGIVFNGIFRRDGKVSGSWTLDALNLAGRISGQRIEEVVSDTPLITSSISYSGAQQSTFENNISLSAVLVNNVPKDSQFGTVRFSDTIYQDDIPIRQIIFAVSQGETNQAKSVTLELRIFVGETSTTVYKLEAVCSEAGSRGRCDGLAIDFANRQVTFNDVELVPNTASDNAATAALILNGRIAWRQ